MMVTLKDRRSFNYYFNNKYNAIRHRVKMRNYYIGLAYMGRNEWNIFLDNTYHRRLKLWDEWVANGYQRSLAPSIDRIDPSKGYVDGNVRWITYSLNCALAKRSENTCKRGHPWSKENIYVSKRKRNLCRICKTDYARAYDKKRSIESREKSRERMDRLEAEQKSRVDIYFQPNRGLCKNGHPWTKENVYVRPQGKTECKTCRVERRA